MNGAFMASWPYIRLTSSMKLMSHPLAAVTRTLQAKLHCTGRESRVCSA